MDYIIDFNPETRLGEKDNSPLHDAIQWCQEEFGMNSFEIENQFPSWRWKFTFHEPEHATHFALRWA